MLWLFHSVSLVHTSLYLQNKGAYQFIAGCIRASLFIELRGGGAADMRKRPRCFMLTTLLALKRFIKNTENAMFLKHAQRFINVSVLTILKQILAFLQLQRFINTKIAF